MAATVQRAVPKTVRQRPKPKAVEHPTPAERAARGKEARAAVPRSVHGEWAPASDRPDPVELLEEQSASRVPELVPVRYGRMLVSPFTFFRGAAYPMAADLAGEPRTGLEVQLCGDAHLSNFGAFAAPDRRLDIQHQRLRRDAPGPVRMGREAAGRELRRGRPGSRPRRARAADDQPDGGPLLPGGDADLRRDVEPRPVVRPHRRGADRRVRGPARGPQAAQAVRAQRGQGPVEGQHEGLREAHDRRRRRAQDRERPAAHRPDRGRGLRRRPGRARDGRFATSSAPTGGPSVPTAGGCSSATGTSMRRARSSAWAAWARARGSC